MTNRQLDELTLDSLEAADHIYEEEVKGLAREFGVLSTAVRASLKRLCKRDFAQREGGGWTIPSEDFDSE